MVRAGRYTVRGKAPSGNGPGIGRQCEKLQPLVDIGQQLAISRRIFADDFCINCCRHAHDGFENPISSALPASLNCIQIFKPFPSSDDHGS
jgi:hypothetical protein